VYPNTEVCRYHYAAGWTVNRQGRMVPVICSVPNEDARSPTGQQVVHVSYGAVTVRGPEEREDSDLLSNVTPGRVCVTAVVDLPETCELMVDSAAPSCEEIE
jgi:hypothetical protein